MRRLFISSLLFLFVLGGCAQINQSDLESAILASMEDVADNPNNSINNMRKSLYTYYLPKSVGRISSTELSSILISHNTKILMNLDVVAVLSETYYSDTQNVLRSFVNKEAALVDLSGFYLDSDFHHIDYTVTVIKLSHQKVLLTLQTEYFIFSSIAAMALSPELVFDMLSVARSIKMDKPAVLLAYSQREIINYQKETLSIFSQISPESGTVLDMITNSDNPPTQGE
jgi:hypothetical protein